MSPRKDKGYYYAEYKHEGMTSAKQAFILQTPIKRDRMKAIREVLLRATCRKLMILIESEEGVFECKWTNIVRKDRKQLRKWLPEIFEDEETDHQLVSNQSIELQLDEQMAGEQKSNKWEDFEKIRQGNGYEYGIYSQGEYRRHPIFFMVTPYVKEKIPRIKIALYEAINDGIMLMEKDADPIRFCKDPNEMFAFSWGDEVRKNPEKLINYLPNLFPDDPAVKRRNTERAKKEALYLENGYQYIQVFVEEDKQEDGFLMKKPFKREKIADIRSALHLAISKGISVAIENEKGEIEECKWTHAVRQTPHELRNYLPELFPQNEEEEITTNLADLELKQD